MWEYDKHKVANGILAQARIAKTETEESAALQLNGPNRLMTTRTFDVRWDRRALMLATILQTGVLVLLLAFAIVEGPEDFYSSYPPNCAFERYGCMLTDIYWQVVLALLAMSSALCLWAWRSEPLSAKGPWIYLCAFLICSLTSLSWLALLSPIYIGFSIRWVAWLQPITKMQKG